MLQVGRTGEKNGQRVAAAGIVAALAAPSSLIVGSDLLMAVAIFGFCVCVVAGHRPGNDPVALFATALASVVCLVCVPAAPGVMQHALAFAFSCGCIALASMAAPLGARDAQHGKGIDPVDAAEAA
jgi:hypothetical protein